MGSELEQEAPPDDQPGLESMNVSSEVLEAEFRRPPSDLPARTDYGIIEHITPPSKLLKDALARMLGFSHSFCIFLWRRAHA